MLNKYIDIQILCDIAIAAGKESLKYFQKLGGTDIETKEDESPVTVADFATHKIIDELLEKNFPSIPRLSEESERELFEKRFEWEKFFLIDPIDGTKEFIKGSDEFTINIALIKNCESTLGVIYQPVRDILYYGDTGESFKVEGGAKLKLPIEQYTPGKIRIVSSKSHKNKETTEYIEKLKSEYLVESFCFGSSLKLCKVAEGVVDLNPRLGGTSEWDIAAGHAIIRGARGDILLMGTNDRVQYNKESLLNPWYEAKRLELL